MRKPLLSLCAIAFFLSAIQSHAQVGFNNPNPDPSAVVDIKSSDKGILIPRMSTGLRLAMAIGTPTPAQGLLVFDTDHNRLYFWDAAQWRPVNVVAADSTGTNEIARVATEMTIGNGYSNTTPPNNGLIVEGNVAIGQTDPGTNKLAVTGTTSLNGSTSVTGNLVVSANSTVSGNSSVTGDLEVTGTVTATDYALPSGAGNGPVPSGGIIMWSGSTSAIPTGWALCDGLNGTPDLRDRFIVGAGNIYSPGNTGGDTVHSHTASTVAAHTHGLSGHTQGITSFNPSGSYPSGYYAYDDNEGWSSGSFLETGHDPNHNEGQHAHSLQGSTDSAGGHTHTIGSSDSRPPYYALAFIMKL